jgi:hypothetical protein
MRRKLVLGMGLAGLLSGQAAVGQFAADQVPGGAVPQPKAFGGAQPAGAGFQPAPGGYSPPVGGFAPSTYPAAGPSAANVPPVASMTPPLNVEIPYALPQNHEWALKPETGPWFICVKSYSRPGRPDPSDPGMTALWLAETLAAEIRQTYKVQAWLYEYVSEEKRAQAEARARALQQRDAFQNALAQRQQQAQLQGMQFLDHDNRIYYKTFNYRDQIAVLVGPFQTEEDALKAVPQMKKWKPPEDKRLMDGGAINMPGPGGKTVSEMGFISPYAQPMVVPNPTIPRTPKPVEGLDPLIVKLNEGRPYNLLMAKKGWTLAVKSYGAPVQIQSRDDEPSMARKMGLSSGADVLAAGAGQAEQLAKALREMKAPGGQPLHLEAFVLHTRSASIVTVGQFDGPNDPALMETRRILMGLTFNVSKDAGGGGMMGTSQKLFGDQILPMPIPQLPKP